MTEWTIILSVLALAIGFGAGFALRTNIIGSKLAQAQQDARQILEDARKQAESAKREALLQAKEEAHRLRMEGEQELRDRRSELASLEKRLVQKEEMLDRKAEGFEQKEKQLAEREAEVAALREQTQELKRKQELELERVAGLSREEAREILLANVREETRTEAAHIMYEIEMKARAEAEEKSKEIIAMAIQRCASDHVSELTVSVVSLPSEEMKGRIIGREGRNIRAFEALTGVDLIIDDTPEAVVISAFDPIRREKARLTLQRLIADGRIHPGRIEEMYEKSEQEVEEAIRKAGEQAVYDTRVHGLHPELVRIMGRLKYRTSYGQNVLKHSIEVAHLASMMADMLGANATIARRAGLVHDIGKALDHELEGTHITIGMDLLKKYGEAPEVIHAMSTHHGDFEAESVEAVLVTAADALSAARPGARRETLESYIRRLEKLEEIARSFEGVEKSYAIQAGREIRIMVKPDQIDDALAYKVAKDIVQRIEDELQYPGQIKVTVIRETRAVEYAR